jgi:transposase-like protein
MSKKQRISTEMKANITDALAGGLSYAAIAERYGVSYSTIQRVKSAVINGANFIAKKEVPEVHDTPTEQKESPEAPTPRENASEDITADNIDTNIIPEVPENVKPDDYSPYNPAVDDAVLERIERLRDKIADLQLEMSNYETELNVLEEFHLKYMEAQNNERSNENC